METGSVFFKEKVDYSIVVLMALYITSLLANLAVGYRYISIGNLIQSGGIFIFPWSFIISDIVTERYGSIFAKKMVKYGIICQFIFAIYAYSVIHLPAPEILLNEKIYYQVFSPYLNFALASSISIWLGSWVNIVLLSKLSALVGGKYFALRSLLSSTAGELLVTIVSMLIANYGKMENNLLIYMICCCFFIKTIISFVAIWPAAVFLSFLQNDRNKDLLLTIDNIKHPIRFLKNLAWFKKHCF